MNLDQDFFQVSKFSEDFTRNGTLFFSEFRWRPKKKGTLHQKWNTFFPEFRWRPKTKTKKGLHLKWNTFLSTDLRSDAYQSQIIGGDADKDHTQIVGGYTVKLLGVIYPPLVRHHCYCSFVGLSTKMQNKKYHVFSNSDSETVFRTEIDQKVN